jgi:hypothetical protein
LSLAVGTLSVDDGQFLLIKGCPFIFATAVGPRAVSR